jgi:hypothetical protein
MKESNMRKRKRALFAATVLALALAGVAGAAQSGLLTIRLAEAGRPAAAGIQVHGKWSLVVHNRKGKVVARRRFENALTPQGASVLQGLISVTSYFPDQGGVVTNGGFGSIGGQGVQLEDGSTAGHGCRLVFTTNLCLIERDNGSNNGGLRIATTASNMTLSGNITPPTTTTFTKVETLLKTCTTDHSQQDCGSASSGDAGVAWRTFTSKTLGTPLTVQGGQSVAVSVQISFS